jgi:hypothetical protein
LQLCPGLIAFGSQLVYPLGYRAGTRSGLATQLLDEIQPQLQLLAQAIDAKFGSAQRSLQLGVLRIVTLRRLPGNCHSTRPPFIDIAAEQSNLRRHEASVRCAT